MYLPPVNSTCILPTGPDSTSTEVFPHIAGGAVFESAGTLLVNRTAVASHCVFTAGNSAEDGCLGDVAGYFYTTCRALATITPILRTGGYPRTRTRRTGPVRRAHGIPVFRLALRSLPRQGWRVPAGLAFSPAGIEVTVGAGFCEQALSMMDASSIE